MQQVIKLFRSSSTFPLRQHISNPWHIRCTLALYILLPTLYLPTFYPIFQASGLPKFSRPQAGYIKIYNIAFFDSTTRLVVVSPRSDWSYYNEYVVGSAKRSALIRSSREQRTTDNLEMAGCCLDFLLRLLSLEVKNCENATARRCHRRESWILNRSVWSHCYRFCANFRLRGY